MKPDIDHALQSIKRSDGGLEYTAHKINGAVLYRRSNLYGDGYPCRSRKTDRPDSDYKTAGKIFESKIKSTRKELRPDRKSVR